jgi:hypothetical protein
VSWCPINLRHIGDRPAVKPTLGGLIYPGKRHVFSGPQESAKTIAAYALALEQIRVPSDDPNCGFVVLIDLEMGQYDCRDRLVEMGATDDDLEALWYIEPETPAGEETIPILVEDGAALAIIDAAAGAYAIQDLDDNKRRDAELWANLWVRPFWQRGIATIVIDHVVKNADNRGKYAIGSERKVGGVDVHLGFEPIGQPLTRGGDALYKITTHKDRPGWLPRPRAGELELVSDPETHAITWTFKPPSSDAESGDGWRPTVLIDRVLEHVERYDYEPVSRSALAGAVHGRREYVLKAIDCLLADERLTLDGKKVVPVPRNVPGTFPTVEGNGNVPRSLPLQGERNSGTLLESEA